MKRQILTDIFTVLAIAAFLTLVFSSHGNAQDTVKAHPKKGIVVVKIKTDDNGKTKSVDTVFALKGPESEKALQEYMKQYEDQMEELGDRMKDIEIDIDMPHLLDSLGIDSLKDEIIRLGCVGGVPHHFMQDFDKDFEYEFEIPEPPFPPDVPGNFYYQFRDHPERQRFGHNEEGTLNELLGPIPLESVKNYRIIEKKGGKRIIIDLDNNAFDHGAHKKVIIRRSYSE